MCFRIPVWEAPFCPKKSKSLYPIIYVPQYTSDVMKADQSGQEQIDGSGREERGERAGE